MKESLTTQQKMLKILTDGLPHTREELHACLIDELQPLSSVRKHAYMLRKTLRQKGHDIICVLHRRTICYQHVILLPVARKRFMDALSTTI